MKKIREYMAIQRAEDKRKEQMTIYEINDPFAKSRRIAKEWQPPGSQGPSQPSKRRNVFVWLQRRDDYLCKVNDCEKYTYA